MSKIEKSVRRERKTNRPRKSGKVPIIKKDKEKKSRKSWRDIREKKENFVIDIIKGS